MDVQLEEKTNVYAIVVFLPKQIDNENSVDLVPSKWITKSNEELLCQYPPAEDYHKLDECVQDLKDAKDCWEKFPVEIMSYAGKFTVNIVL